MFYFHSVMVGGYIAEFIRTRKLFRQQRYLKTVQQH